MVVPWTCGRTQRPAKFVAWWIGLMAIVYLITAYPTTLRPDVAARWSLSPDRLWPETWITYSLLHTGFWHLAANAALLWLAGGLVERIAGLRAMVALTAGAVLFAGLAEVLFDPAARSGVVGASGAVAACFACGLVLEPRAEVQFYDVGLGGIKRLAGERGIRLVWFGAFAGAATLVLEAAIPEFQTAHAAHIAGIVYGAAFGLYWKSKRTVVRR